MTLPTYDQFQSNFDLGMNQKRFFTTSYKNHFYFKNNDQVNEHIKILKLVQ
jgi:hypothetical protein